MKSESFRSITLCAFSMAWRLLKAVSRGSLKFDKRGIRPELFANINIRWKSRWASMVRNAFFAAPKQHSKGPQIMIFYSFLMFAYDWKSVASNPHGDRLAILPVPTCQPPNPSSLRWLADPGVGSAAPTCFLNWKGQGLMETVTAQWFREKKHGISMVFLHQ